MNNPQGSRISVVPWDHFMRDFMWYKEEGVLEPRERRGTYLEVSSAMAWRGFFERVQRHSPKVMLAGQLLPMDIGNGPDHQLIFVHPDRKPFFVDDECKNLFAYRGWTYGASNAYKQVVGRYSGKPGKRRLNIATIGCPFDSTITVGSRKLFSETHTDLIELGVTTPETIEEQAKFKEELLWRQFGNRLLQWAGLYVELVLSWLSKHPSKLSNGLKKLMNLLLWLLKRFRADEEGDEQSLEPLFFPFITSESYPSGLRDVGVFQDEYANENHGRR